MYIYSQLADNKHDDDDDDDDELIHKMHQCDISSLTPFLYLDMKLCESVGANSVPRIQLSCKLDQLNFVGGEGPQRSWAAARRFTSQRVRPFFSCADSTGGVFVFFKLHRIKLVNQN